MGQIPQDRENGQDVAFFLKLYCDQTDCILAALAPPYLHI